MDILEIWELGHKRKIQEHPCYDPKASHKFGRIHLPVAPRCNIQCNYCIRDYDCIHESRPGVTSQVLTPQEAIIRLEELIKKYSQIKVVGIAGPGDPLANEETFVVLDLVQKRFPFLLRCLSTNGLLLPDKIDILEELGVSNITVTLNTVDPKIGGKIYSSVTYKGKTFSGLEGAELLLSQQLTGIQKAAQKGFIVKINTVYIPTINDRHLLDVAKKAKELGAFIQNIIPLIPQYQFKGLRKPTLLELREAQNACGRVISQMRHCRQCRADAVGMLGENSCLSMKDKVLVTAKEGHNSVRIAVATSGDTGLVDQHFGHTRNFYIYEVKDGNIHFLEDRNIESIYCQGPECNDPDQILFHIIEMLKDCQFLICKRIGTYPQKLLERAGIKCMMDFRGIEESIRALASSLPGMPIIT